MSEQKDDTCQACLGTGAVAGAQPVRTGPFLLKPPPCRVCGGTGEGNTIAWTATTEPARTATKKRLRFHMV